MGDCCLCPMDEVMLDANERLTMHVPTRRDWTTHVETITRAGMRPSARPQNVTSDSESDFVSAVIPCMTAREVSIRLPRGLTRLQTQQRIAEIYRVLGHKIRLPCAVPLEGFQHESFMVDDQNEASGPFLYCRSACPSSK